MIRFYYAVSYDHQTAQTPDDRVTALTISTALKAFHDELRERMRALDAQSSVTVTEHGLTAIQSTIRPDMIDEVVQRRAGRHHLTAKLETVA